MQRITLVTIVTVSLVILAAVFLTAAAPAAPRWPAASLDYWEQVRPNLAIIETQSKTAMSAVGKPDATQTISDAVTAVTSAASAIAKIEPPTALLPLAIQIDYTGETCLSAIKYASSVKLDNIGAAVSVPVFTQFGIECRNAIQAAHMEAARYASTVGGFPVNAEN